LALTAHWQLEMKTVKDECFFCFTFGKSKDEKLIIQVTEFVDSVAFTGGGDSSETKANSGSKHAETPVQALSSSLCNCIKASGKRFVDVVLFAPRCLMYVINATTEKKVAEFHKA
jgi:hypothetical protein